LSRVIALAGLHLLGPHFLRSINISTLKVQHHHEALFFFLVNALICYNIMGTILAG